MDIHIDLIIAGIINFLILIFLFRKFLWDKLITEIEEREKMKQKLKNADKEYKKMITFAQQESKAIVEKAEQEKQKIIHEGHLIAEEEKNKILWEAKIKAIALEQDAKNDWEKLKRTLQDERVNAVKSTSKKVVKKLLKTDKNLKDAYLQELIHDFEHYE